MPPRLDSAETGPEQVEMRDRLGVEGLGHVPTGHHNNDDGQRQVDEKNPPPARSGDQVPTDEGAEARGDAAQARNQAPIAFARSAGREGGAEMMARTAGGQQRTTDPLQCSRAAISASIVGAMAHSADAAANQMTPTVKTRRRPYRSPGEPPSRMNQPSVRV